MKSFEQFSPETQQAIDSFRTDFRVQAMKIYGHENFWIVAVMALNGWLLAKEVNPEEFWDALDFVKSKNYFL